MPGLAPGRKRILASLLYAGSVAALGLLCFLALRVQHKDHPVFQAEGRSFADIPSEEIVESYILQTTPHSDSVQFLRWGPHDLTGELVAHRKGNDDRIIRARYRCRNRDGEWVVEDNLFYFLNNEVTQVVRNPWGDEWRPAVQRLNEGKPAVEPSALPELKP
jgi:hypothetical protein